jgi:hypothetical protein
MAPGATAGATDAPTIATISTAAMPTLSAAHTATLPHDEGCGGQPSRSQPSTPRDSVQMSESELRAIPVHDHYDTRSSFSATHTTSGESPREHAEVRGFPASSPPAS